MTTPALPTRSRDPPHLWQHPPCWLVARIRLICHAIPTTLLQEKLHVMQQAKRTSRTSPSKMQRHPQKGTSSIAPRLFGVWFHYEEWWSSPFKRELGAPAWTLEEYPRIFHIVANLQHLIAFIKLNIPLENCTELDKIIHDPWGAKFQDAFKSGEFETVELNTIDGIVEKILFSFDSNNRQIQKPGETLRINWSWLRICYSIFSNILIFLFRTIRMCFRTWKRISQSRPLCTFFSKSLSWVQGWYAGRGRLQGYQDSWKLIWSPF